jgi:uncharacterized protein (TIGR03435 family)
MKESHMQSRSSEIVRRSRHASMLHVSILTAACLVTMVAHSQAPAPAPSSQAPTPTYDVVSIKQNKSGSGSMSFSGGTGSFKGTNFSLTMLLINSYAVRDDLIYGLPGWTRSARFDIDAKIVNPDKEQMDKLTDEQRREMLLSILKDRFHFQAHLETKILPVYDLIIAKSGPKFTGGTEENKDIAAAVTQKHLMAGGMLANDGELTAAGAPVSSLAYSLGGVVGRTVIDKTGLTGEYNFELKWTPERGDQANADNGQADPQNASSSIFTALEEQLGLKLQSAKGPVQTLVVDHVEMPSEN